MALDHGMGMGAARQGQDNTTPAGATSSDAHGRRLIQLAPRRFDNAPFRHVISNFYPSSSSNLLEAP